MQRVYRSMGLIAGGGTIPFVSSVSFLRTPRPDSTLTLVALSMPSRVLSFAREGDRYASTYSVRVEARQGNLVAREVDAKETVRVPTYRETSRTDESVIWQQYLRLAPGRYTLILTVKDEASLRTSVEEVTIEVPRLAPGALGSAIAVYEAIPRSSIDSLPRLLARPRSTVVFGTDSVLPVYVEAAGPDAPGQVDARVIGEGDVLLWQSLAELPKRGTSEVRSTTIGVPVSRMGIGVSTLVLSTAGSRDTVRSRVFVSLGEDLPIASFEEMIGYLRYFASADRLKPLHDAPPAGRADAWTQFLKATDPITATPEHEGLRDYFLRIRTANARYRDDDQVGWLSDRGIAYVGLGEPDNIYNAGSGDPTSRARQEVWEYSEYRLQLVFYDQSGFGRWRLQPSGRSELQATIRRKLAR